MTPMWLNFFHIHHKKEKYDQGVSFTNLHLTNQSSFLFETEIEKGKII